MFAFCNTKRKHQRLEKEENNTNDLYEKHECYELKLDYDNNNIEYKKIFEEPYTSRKLRKDTMKHEYTLQTSKHDSKKDYTLNVDIWDNNMKCQYNIVDTDTFE